MPKTTIQLIEPPEDPTTTCERWLMSFAGAFGLSWPAPRHSLCLKIVRMLFEADLTMDDLELCLQSMYAARKKPRSYESLMWEVRDWIRDADHAARTKPKPKN